MKKAMAIILIVVAVIIIVSGGIYAYYGGFSKVVPYTAQQGGETIVYKEVIGDYKQTPSVMDEVYYSLLNDNKIETTKGFGIYYDNPRNVETSKLRSEIGCMLDEPVDSTTLVDISARYKVKIYPEDTYLVAEFPNKGMISTLVGIMKVYPALNKYAKENGFQEDSPVAEIYDMPSKKILYRKQLIK